MPFQIFKGDITKIRCDAIVNAANSSLLGGGGVDGAIHRAAGGGLLRECMTLGGCETGCAKITGGYNLPSKYVIHTVGPIWSGGGRGERELLESCYRSSLALAKEKGCESIAFPLISSGIYGYPLEEALEVAVGAISEFLRDNEMYIVLVIFEKSSFRINSGLYDSLSGYISRKLGRQHGGSGGHGGFGGFGLSGLFDSRGDLDEYAEYEEYDEFIEADAYEAAEEAYEPDSRPGMCGSPFAPAPSAAANSSEVRKKPSLFAKLRADALPGASESASLRDILNQQLDESFSEMLLRKIDEKGITDSECYRKANIDRKLFSKIRGDRNYRPSKPTVIAFAIALELPLDETTDMLKKAGFALSHSNVFDIIIEYFIKKENYDIFEINEALFAFDQSLLGC